MQYDFDNIGNAKIGNIKLRFQGDKGNPSDITHQKDPWILKTYKSFFESSKFKPKNILEIGINHGGSMIIWHELFKCRVVGIDITFANITPAAMRYIDADKDVSIYLSDSTTKKKMLEIITKEFPNGIDIVIDDGAHNLDYISKTFDILWPHTNGIYIVEDWKVLGKNHKTKLLTKLINHTIGYWPAPNPGKNDPWKVEFYKRFIAIHR